MAAERFPSFVWLRHQVKLAALLFASLLGTFALDRSLEASQGDFPLPAMYSLLACSLLVLSRRSYYAGIVP